jgi:hypothetical protein
MKPMKTLKQAVLLFGVIFIFAQTLALAEGGRVGNGKKADSDAEVSKPEAATPAPTPAPTAEPKPESK